MGNIIGNLRMFDTLVVLYTRIKIGEMSMDLCHIELVAGRANDSRKHGSVWLCPEPENDHDSGAIAVHDVDGRIGYVSRRFSGLAMEEISRGSQLRVLSSLSKRVWYCALSN